MTLNRTEQNIGTITSIFSITLILLYIAFAVIGFGNEVVLLGIIGGILISTTLFCLLLLRKYRKENIPEMIDRLNVGTQRYILGLFMLMYGIDKLLGNFFDYQLFALDTKLADVSEFQLAWFFYGKSRWQELFTGIMEFVPALFLFHRRTYYAAALVLLPVTGQVFLLNLFFKIGGITLPAATVLLACNIYIIYSQKEKLLHFFRSLDLAVVPLTTGRTRAVIRVLKGLGIFLACFVVFIKVRPVLFRSAAQQKYQRLVGIYTLRDGRRNGIACGPADSSCYKDLYIEKQSRWNILRRGDGTMDAFLLRMNAKNDSITLAINKGGTGDGPTIIDSATLLKAICKQAGAILTLSGMQGNDTVELVYEKQDRILPKRWFW